MKRLLVIVAALCMTASAQEFKYNFAYDTTGGITSNGTMISSSTGAVFDTCAQQGMGRDENGTCSLDYDVPATWICSPLVPVEGGIDKRMHCVALKMGPAAIDTEPIEIIVSLTESEKKA
jgi:hypothetical protein